MIFPVWVVPAVSYFRAGTPPESRNPLTSVDMVLLLCSLHAIRDSTDSATLAGSRWPGHPLATYRLPGLSHGQWRHAPATVVKKLDQPGNLSVVSAPRPHRFLC